MKKITLQTPNITAQNIDKIAELFPNCITETKDENGTLKKAVNFDVLKQMLSEDVMEGSEAYEFTWVGKRAATVEAFKPIDKTLRPCPEESVDWDSTQNLYIEGDNLEVLKLLQENYLKKVKMIYIDPPYNTGNDFIYKDDFRISEEEWEELSDEYDEEGNRLYKNTESNGRFHSDWCSMIYSRLLLARGLLTDDGVIFISIDNNEQENLKKICDEVFGWDNCIGVISNSNNPKGRSDDKFIATAHEYILVYAKNILATTWFGFEPTEEITRRYNKIDSNGKKYREIDLRKTGENDLREDRPNLFYYFYYNQTTGELIPECEDKVINGFIQIKPQREDGKEGNWRWGIETAKNQINELIPKFMPNRKVWGIMQKDFLEGRALVKPTSSWTFKDVNSERGTQEFIDLGFDKRLFAKPKPIGTIKRCIKLSTSNMDNSIVLDFFSGSATTAHAVMQLNAEDGGNRRFIMVQIPEVCDENSEAFKAGYKTICEIGKERIRRAGAKIKESIAQDDSLFSSDAPELDTGFRVFKVADSNMTDVDIQLSMYSQDKLDQMVENIKADRTPLDLLFGCALEWGLELTMPYSSEPIDGYTIHTYSQGENIDLIACFDKDVPESIFRTIAEKKPLRVVFRDSCFKDCPSKINAEEIIKTLSPETDVRVI